MNDTKLSIRSNVLVRTINTFTGKAEEFHFHNRVTKNALLGMARFIYGDFSSSSSEVNKYVPNYLALGGYEKGSTEKHPSNVDSVNALNLTNEITNTTTSIGIITPRLEIASRNISNEIANDYVKVTFKIFVPSTSLQNTVINEAGLFATIEGNSCWARIGLNDNPIEKDNSTTIDIIWDIVIRSISNSTVSGG